MTLTDEHLELLARTNEDAQATVRKVANNADTIFTWDYEKGTRTGLNKLYEKAKGAQWNGETDLDWSIEVDQEALIRQGGIPDRDALAELGIDITGTSFEKWGEKEWLGLEVESENWALSQFMHGEQGALVCTAKIVETVPWIDAKYYAATQVMDEARHVEVFAKYLDTKLSGWYPVNTHLQALLDDIINDSRWDMVYLGMQVMIEGLALAAFGHMMNQTQDPLLKQLLRYVMSDEARHVAFGVLSLQEYYGELTEAELLDRQEFAFDAAIRMRDRFQRQEVWERVGIDVKEAVRTFTSGDPNADPFQQLLFAKIVPNCKKLGLLDANDGWLRKKFETMQVIQFEDLADTEAEYELFDATGT
ncbi:MAG: ferritin-like domain-containing protein [Actinomycetia bacterium]|nr:ferritin-like domain-containing protein [Actinomycetes bacterium]MCP5035649.1 ferritin-like domain-containing protein [Actinomycetes bacterium]